MPLETPTPGMPAFTLDLRFPGQRFDEETGLFHNGFRDYHPGLGRYVQSDPLGIEAGWNTYGYVGGNPIFNKDPLGLETVVLFAKDDPANGVIEKNTPKTPGVFYVWGHGFDGYMINSEDQNISPADLIPILKQSGWKQGQPIMLMSCDTGRGENSFAQRLNVLSQGAVAAPTTRIWTLNDNVVGLWEAKVDPKTGRVKGSPGKRYPNKSAPGKWKIFK
mgnify:CR=1 FL=1